MKLLSIVKAKRRNKEEQRKIKRMSSAMSSAGAAFVGTGFIGLVVFGYEIFQSGGFSALTAMADGIGLILSIILLIAGIYMK